MPPPANLSDLSRAELEALLIELLGDAGTRKTLVFLTNQTALPA